MGAIHRVGEEPIDEPGLAAGHRQVTLLEPAVTAVLGERLQGVVVDRADTAQRAVGLLKTLEEGRTSFLPLDARKAVATGGAGHAGAAAWSDPRAAESTAPAKIEVVDASPESSGSEAASAPAGLPEGEGVLGRLSDLVEVGPSGTVSTWCWVNQPREKHPLARPFAWALIQLDGATSGFLHAVDAGQESAMKTGMRVAPQFSNSPSGGIRDIECFVPEEGA